MSKLQSHPSPSETPLGSAQVTSGLDHYGEVMASGLWVGDSLGSEDMQILTQINLGLHRSVYKREVNFPCGSRKRYRCEGP